MPEIAARAACVAVVTDIEIGSSSKTQFIALPVIYGILLISLFYGVFGLVG
jgi:hypothetical protein